MVAPSLCNVPVHNRIHQIFTQYKDRASFLKLKWMLGSGADSSQKHWQVKKNKEKIPNHENPKLLLGGGGKSMRLLIT